MMRVRQAALVLALVFALIGLPTVAAIEGHMTDVWWGDSNIHPTATITPQDTIQNDGSERTIFHDLFSVQDPSGGSVEASNGLLP